MGEVDLPPLQPPGTPVIWCERNASNISHVGDISAEPTLRLESRQPRWSPRLNTLVLDFFGRATRASAKNVQLEVAGRVRDLKEKPEFLHGKVGDNTFVLDYKHPLSMVQVFA